MGDGFQIKGFIKIKQYKKDGTVIRDEKVYNKVTDIGRQWFLHKGSSPILQNNLSNFGQSDFYSKMDTKSYNANNNVYGYRYVSDGYPRNYLFNLQQDLYDKHKAAGGAKNFVGDKNTLPTVIGYASMNADPKDITGSAATQGLTADSTNVGVTEDFMVSQTWRYPEGCAVGSINAIGMLQYNFDNNDSCMGYSKCITPRILNASTDVGTVQSYIPPNVVYNRGKEDEVVWTKQNEIIVYTTNHSTFKIELDTGKMTELIASDLGYGLDFIPANVAAYINCTLYGENKVLYVAYLHANIRIVSIGADNINVAQGSATSNSYSDSQSNYRVNYTDKVVSMFTKIVNGERHVFIIGNYYYYNNSDGLVYYVSEWKLNGTRVSLNTTALNLSSALNNVTGINYSSAVAAGLVGIVDACDSKGYLAIKRFEHSRESDLSLEKSFNVNYGIYFTDITDYDNSLTDRALITGDSAAGVLVINDKLCSIFFGRRSEIICTDYSSYNASRANLMFSKEGWAGNLISMKLLIDPIVKEADDILDITYGYEIGEKVDV